MLDKMPILVVEDEPMIALDLSLAVEDLDGTVVGPADNVAQALALIGSRSVAAAVLDAKLGSESVTSVALRLHDAGVPFVIHSGTGIPEDLETAHPGLPFLPKPAAAVTVLVALLREMQARSATPILHAARA